MGVYLLNGRSFWVFAVSFVTIHASNSRRFCECKKPLLTTNRQERIWGILNAILTCSCSRIYENHVPFPIYPKQRLWVGEFQIKPALWFICDRTDISSLSQNSPRQWRPEVLPVYKWFPSPRFWIYVKCPCWEHQRRNVIIKLEQTKMWRN